MVSALDLYGVVVQYFIIPGPVKFMDVFLKDTDLRTGNAWMLKVHEQARLPGSFTVSRLSRRPLTPADRS